MPNPTRNDVARFARVSGATVSRVLNARRDLSIAPETRKRVLEAIQALGYRPNPTARALAAGCTKIVGLWMCLDYSRYRAQVVGRMQKLLRQSDYCMAITDIEEEIGRNHSFERAASVPADGVIAFDTPTAGAAFASSAPADRGSAFVSMGAFWDERISYVGVDLHAGAVAAMEHLVTTGRKRIAFLLPNADDQSPAMSRFSAYAAVMDRSGQQRRTILVDQISVGAAAEAVAEHLGKAPDIDAILCLSDDLALGAYHGIERAGRRVGRDVALVGCDGIEETEHVGCPITTIRQPVEQMCSLAWQFLQERVDNPTCPLRQVILQPALIVRASSGIE